MDPRLNKNLSKQGRSEHGFTLIEILIVLFVTALLLTAFFTLFDWHNKVYKYQEAVVRTSGSSRASLQALSFYISQAHRILSNQTINGTNYISGASALVAQLPAIDSSGNALAGKWDYAVFYTDGNNFYQLIQADSSSSRLSGTKLLSDALNSVTFTYDNANFDSVKEVSVDFQAQLQVKTQMVSNRMEQNIYLENY